MPAVVLAEPCERRKEEREEHDLGSFTRAAPVALLMDLGRRTKQRVGGVSKCSWEREKPEASASSLWSTCSLP